MKLEKISVFGSGNLGGEIAMLAAFKGFDVTIYDKDNGLLEEAKTKFREYGDQFKKELGATAEEIDAAMARMAFSTEIEAAVGNAQLAIVAIPEEPEAKSEFYTALSKVAPKNTIFLTTSTSFSIEDLAHQTERPDHFMGILLTSPLWRQQSAKLNHTRHTNSKALKMVHSFIDTLSIEQTG